MVLCVYVINMCLVLAAAKPGPAKISYHERVGGLEPLRANRVHARTLGGSLSPLQLHVGQLLLHKQLFASAALFSAF